MTGAQKTKQKDFEPNAYQFFKKFFALTRF